VVVDTQGFLLAVVVTAADEDDRDGARWVLRRAHHYWPSVQHVWADQGYTGADLADALRQAYGLRLEIVRHAEDQVGFVVLPRRWVVERTHAWLGRRRRLSKEYEREVEYTETVIYLASLHHLLRRLAPDPHAPRPYTARAA
jgi:transposase